MKNTLNVPYSNITVKDAPGGEVCLRVSLSSGRVSGEVLIFLTPDQAEHLAEQLRA